MGKGDNQKTTQTTKVEPWAPLQPYLKGAMSDAQSMYQEGAPNYYPGQTIAPMSGYTRGSLDAMAQRAASGSDLTRAAQGELQNTLGGNYLSGGNPYLQNAISSATRPMINAYNDQVMPGLDSNFSAAGRYGSGAHALASSDAGAQLQSQIGDVASQMAYQNYNDERQNMMRGMLLAPELAAQDYKDIGMLGQAGAGYDTYNQNLINADTARYDYGQNADWNYLKDYITLLGGAPSPGSTGTTKTPLPSPLAQVGGLLAGGLGSYLGSGGSLLGGTSAPVNPYMIGTFY